METMAENPSDSRDNGKLIAISILVVVLVVAGVFIITFDVFNLSSAITDAGPKQATTYAGVTIDEAYDLINTTYNLTIIETRSCSCKYNAGHIADNSTPSLFEAIHEPNWLVYNNTDAKLLVYDANGNDEAITYCEEMINQTFYGDIYYIIGGFNAWLDAGYPTVSNN